MRTYAVVTIYEDGQPELVYTHGPGTADVWLGGFGGRGVFANPVEAAMCLEAFEEFSPESVYAIFPGEAFGTPIVETYVSGFMPFDDGELLDDEEDCEFCEMDWDWENPFTYIPDRDDDDNYVIYEEGHWT